MNKVKAFEGSWDNWSAAHLAKRTLIGPTIEQIKKIETIGLDKTIEDLLVSPKTDLPLSYLPEEKMVKLGEPWCYSFYPKNKKQIELHETARKDSLTGWLIKRMNDSHFSLQEKMTMFWHNHFAVKPDKDSRATFVYHKKIQDNAFGNVKKLVKEMTIDPAMLIFLNGESNSKTHPNENFARELLEMYTIGKGDQKKKGDYTNYTEKDIKEGAKMLSGWKIKGVLSDVELVTSYFDNNDHNNECKKLSTRFNKKKISNNKEQEYETYINIIFEQKETAKFICRKLYRWFVYDEINADTEENIIEPLSRVLMEQDYEIKPVLRLLLTSEHFFDSTYRGSIVKNPVEYLFSMLNPTNTSIQKQLTIRGNSKTNSIYNLYMIINSQLSLMGMNYISPPSVSGWKAYYQKPQYYKLWLNGSRLNSRLELARLYTQHNGISFMGETVKISGIKFFKTLTNRSEMESILEEIELCFFPAPMSDNKRTKVKEMMLNNISKNEWNNNQKEENEVFLEKINTNTNKVLEYLFVSPEFQMI